MSTKQQLSRKQRAYDRFARGFKHDRAERDHGYKVRKAVEQASLERALGIPSTQALATFLAESGASGEQQ